MNQETVKYGETFRCRFVYIIFELHSNTFWRLKRNISGKILAYHISLPMYGGDYFLKNNKERTLCEHTSFTCCVCVSNENDYIFRETWCKL